VFPVTATAEQVQVLDPKALMAQLKGKPASDARRILAQYGDATLTLWPDWVTTVPGFDARIDVRVGAAPSAARPTASPSPTSSPSASAPGLDGSASPSSAP
jgi:hypothetical protein